MLTIGICGASGSGKSTLAQELQKRMNGKVVLLTQDCYYRDHSHLPFDERKRINYDEPDVFEHDSLLADVTALQEGRPITAKGYDFPHHCRADSGEPIFPGDVLIVEGIHVFYDPRLREKMDLKLYMNVDPDICLLRRVQRDINERGRDIDNISMQYTTTVKPMFDQYIRNYEQYADVIVAKGGRNAKINEILASYVNNDLHMYRGHA